MSENPTVGVGGPGTTGGGEKKPAISDLLAKLKAKINQNGNGTPEVNLKGAVNQALVTPAHAKGEIIPPTGPAAQERFRGHVIGLGEGTVHYEKGILPTGGAIFNEKTAL